MTRFMLELRGVYLSARSPPESPTSDSKISFTATMLGNMGAALDKTWIAGERELAMTDREAPLFSNNPLGVGLFRE